MFLFKSVRSPAILSLSALASCARAPSVAPLPAFPAGAPYVIYASDGSAIYRTDTRVGSDTVLALLERDAVAAAASPDGSVLALGYSAKDSARLITVELQTGAQATIHTAPRGYIYTLAWSPDGNALAAGFHTVRRRGGRSVPERGDIVVWSRGGPVRRMGCSVSKVVYRWVGNGGVVVGDGWNHYLVDPRNCRTLATVRGEGKRDVSFSPDGERFLYFASRRVRDPRNRRAVTATELRVARVRGGEDLRVIGDGYDPQRARWSPDGTKVLFDVASPEQPGVRHVALFDLESRRVQFFPSRTAQGTPSDTDPHWSPDGDRIVHDRFYGTSGEKVVRSLETDPSAVRVAPVTLLRGDAKELGKTWGWSTSRHVVVVLENSIRIVDVDGGANYTLPVGREVLYVWVSY
ncbi:MAG: hypothetical protein KatS3mg081_2662 [Gemmatimonadales bacterium]|nr:Protein TolB [bacterium HR33]GIW53307.1 MAG: hypothetical protein KatS3mg081_2662 [Gemmatimonadales bacterium]